MDAFEALRARLGEGAPEALRQLPDGQLAELSSALEEAHRRQARAIAAAGERALGHIPRLLRGPIRRIVA